MSDNWEKVDDNPYGLNVVRAAIDTVTGSERVTVRNTETGELRHIDVEKFQTLGEAIEKGQFADDKNG